MNFPRRISSYLGFALMLSLLTFAPLPGVAACKNSGGAVGSKNFGSQVSAGSVKICASAVAVSPARTAVVKTPQKAVAKPAAKPVASKKAIFRKQPNLLELAKPLVKVPVISKSKPKPKVKTKVKVLTKPGSKNATAASEKFTPAAVTGSVYPSNYLGLGQLATFASSATEHYRSGTLLSEPTEVRFTPISIEWDFGEGITGKGGSLNFAYDQEGTYEVQVMVIYKVAYRPKGSKSWIIEPDPIQVADELLIEVSGESEFDSDEPNQAPHRVLLVGESCFARPGSFGCN